MKNQKDLKKIWAQVPPDYYQNGVSNNLLQRYWHNQKILTFKKLVGKKSFKKILDVGCASGRMANEISEIFPKARVVGIDPYLKAISFGKVKYPHIKFLVADGHNLPFKKRSFDLVVCYEVIEHVVNPAKVLKEIKRVLSNDGFAIIAMDSGSWLFRVVWWVWEKTFGRVWQGAHLHPFKHAELQKIIKHSKLKIKRKYFSHFGMEVSFLVQS